MIKGETIVIMTPTYGAADALGNKTVTGYTSSTVDDAVIGPPSTADLEAGRPLGVTVAYTVHVPPAAPASLEGCLIQLPADYGGGTYRVVGAPGFYAEANMPPRWKGYRPVNVEAAHG